MFDQEVALFEGRASAVEEELRRFLEAAARPVEAVVEPAAPPQAEGILPGFGSIAALLDAGASRLATARELHRAQARQAAKLARELAAFARRRPAAALDRPDDEVGAAAAATRAARPAALTSVSEWAVDEVMAALRLSSRAASRLLTACVVLVEQLPATLAALESGDISWDHALALVDRLAPLADGVRAEVEARLLVRAGEWTVGQLRDAARRAVLRADAAAATQRAVEAIRERRVVVYPGEDGMATLSAVLPAPVALACRAALRAYAAEAATPGDDRTLDQRTVDCLADLLLGSADGRPVVQVALTVVAGAGTLSGGNEPGEVDGHPVPARMVRELAYVLGLLPRPSAAPGSPGSRDSDDARTVEDEPIRDDPPAHDLGPDDLGPDGLGHDGLGDDDTGPDEGASDEPCSHKPCSDEPGPGEPPSDEPPSDERPVGGLAELLDVRSLAGTALTRIPEIAVVDELSGQLLSLTTAGEIRRIAACSRRRCRAGRRPCDHPPEGPGLGPPPPTPGYAPAVALERFVRRRDRRCRFPGCRTRAERCDIDHNLPYPAGPTSCDNLCCLCRHHHRLSHQAPGWRMRRLRDGGLEWTTPGGERLVSWPPGYGADGDLPRLQGPAGAPSAAGPAPRGAPAGGPATAGSTRDGSPAGGPATAASTPDGSPAGGPATAASARTGSPTGCRATAGSAQPGSPTVDTGDREAVHPVLGRPPRPGDEPAPF